MFIPAPASLYSLAGVIDKHLRMPEAEVFWFQFVNVGRGDVIICTAEAFSHAHLNISISYYILHSLQCNLYIVNVKNRKPWELLFRSVKYCKYTRIAFKVLNESLFIEFGIPEQEFSGYPAFDVHYYRCSTVPLYVCYASSTEFCFKCEEKENNLFAESKTKNEYLYGFGSQLKDRYLGRKYAKKREKEE